MSISLNSIILRIVFVTLFFNSYQLPAQNISGTWTGNYSKPIFGFNPIKLVVEIFLSNDSIITGASHLYYARNKYEHYTFKGIYNKKDSTVIFKEDSTLAVKLGFGNLNCLGNYKMKLRVTDTLLTLNGKWSDIKRGLFRWGSTGVFLVKKINKITVDEVKKKIESKIAKDSFTITPNVKEKLSRQLDIQSLIEFTVDEKDSIKFEIYDNGEIDGDSISLFFNDSLIVNNKKITTNPITFFLSIDRTNVISNVKLIAESLGTIPPCTAMLIITTKKKRHVVYLSNKVQSNAVIEFFFKE